MPRLTRDARARRAVAYARKRNAAEEGDVTRRSVERALRARLVAENPEASVEVIEERVKRALGRGMRPSAPPPPVEPPPPPTGPQMAAERASMLARKRATRKGGR